MDPKSTAMMLIQLAAAIFPPLAALLHDLLSQAPEASKPLADEIRQRLPVVGASAEAEIDLQRQGL